MSELDVNDAFTSDILEDLNVIRQIQTVSDKGRTVVTLKPIFPIPEGVIVVAPPDDLSRLSDGQNLGKAISIYTEFRLFGPSKDNAGIETQPDQIAWRGSLYEIRVLDDYSNFGRGFIHAVAISIGSVDPPPFEKL